MRSPRFQAPFTLANPNERYPIAVHEGEVAIDLAVYRGSAGLNPSQRSAVEHEIGPILVLAGWAVLGALLALALGGRIMDPADTEAAAAAGAAV